MSNRWLKLSKVSKVFESVYLIEKNFTIVFIITIKNVIQRMKIKKMKKILGRRINEHQHSIQEKQKKLDKIKTLLKLLGKYLCQNYVYI